MADRKQNWNERFFKSFGPRFRIDVANPIMGLGGSDVFRMYGATKQGNKFSLGMNESGRVEMNSDVSIDIIAGQKNDAKSTDIFIHSRSGTIDINVAQNGKVRIRGNNVEIDASESITMNARSIRLEGSDEISLQAPKVWSRGRKGNLVPKTWMQSVSFGSFIGADSLSGFLEKGLQEAAGIVDGIDDLAPELGSLAGKAGDLAKGLGDQLPGMQDQLMGAADTLIPQLESFATSDAVAGLGESLQSSVGGIGDALKANSGAFANFGQGLVPTGY
tara:strand:+ start:1076 stop:1900 length:825 start_codon:yes stop_codon:yes gene_type:complete